MAVQKRRSSVAVKIGNVRMGGEHPIVVQSMTNTDTADVASTVNQVMALAQAGSELVRVTVNTEAAAQALIWMRSRRGMTPIRVPAGATCRAFGWQPGPIATLKAGACFTLASNIGILWKPFD
jgi:4-hydroxy-3-methylbut-2-en-1-yl diphosphate synthase IspG/GcpE